mmetsp:Transcript_48761/g.150594  ORF Transcript_48761/g.150594 Transcript_48761/m.150594 type:complete len:104 (-) Transcript_48761:2-313(-)
MSSAAPAESEAALEDLAARWSSGREEALVCMSARLSALRRLRRPWAEGDLAGVLDVVEAEAAEPRGAREFLERCLEELPQPDRWDEADIPGEVPVYAASARMR